MKPPRGTVLMAVLLAAAAPLAGASLPGIDGSVYRDDTDHPLPGALVVLYDTGGFFVDSTYSRDDGGFRLRTPLSKGRVSIVVTAPGLSQKQELDHDPDRGARNVAFVLPSDKESLWQKAGDFVLSTLGAVFGLAVGLLFRRIVEDPAAAREKKNLFLSELRASVDEALAQIPRTAPGSALAQVAAAVKRIDQLFDRRADVEDALERLDKAGGRTSFRALKDQLGQVEDLLEKAKPLPTAQQDANVRQAETILRNIRQSPLG